MEQEATLGTFSEILDRLTTHQADILIPKLAKDPIALAEIERRVRSLSTHHRLVLGDARDLHGISDSGVHLIVTSPPYWILKDYNRIEGQLGQIGDYEEFLNELDKCWKECQSSRAGRKTRRCDRRRSSQQKETQATPSDPPSRRCPSQMQTVGFRQSGSYFLVQDRQCCVRSRRKRSRLSGQTV